MLGYRIFEAIGSVMILVLTRWSGMLFSVTDLAWVVLLVASIWIALIFRLARTPALRAG